MHGNSKLICVRSACVDCIASGDRRFNGTLGIFLSGSGCPVLIGYSVKGSHTNFLATVLLATLSIPRRAVVGSCVTSGGRVSLHDLTCVTHGLGASTRRAVAILLNTGRA